MHTSLLNPGEGNYIYTNPSVFYSGQANAGPPDTGSKKIPQAVFLQRFVDRLASAQSVAADSDSLYPTNELKSAPFDIDVVFTWVQATPEFNTKKAQWLEKSKKPSDNNNNRYSNSEELKFAIRSVYKYAPWVRHIYVVVNDDQTPDFVSKKSADCPIPVYIVPHSILYEGSFRAHLPTFNSQSIETHIYKIPGLAERFCYFNDDQFIGNHIQWDDFFTAEGLPKIVQGGLAATGKKIPTMSKNAMAWVNNNNLLDKVFPQHRNTLRKCHIHQGVPLLKSKFKQCWEHPIIRPQLEKTSLSKFRMEGDLYFIGFLVHFTLYQQKAVLSDLSNFYVQLTDPSTYSSIFEALVLQKPKLFCINDGVTGRRKLHNTLMTLFLTMLFPDPAPTEEEDDVF